MHVFLRLISLGDFHLVISYLPPLSRGPLPPPLTTTESRSPCLPPPQSKFLSVEIYLMRPGDVEFLKITKYPNDHSAVAVNMVFTMGQPITIRPSRPSTARSMSTKFTRSGTVNMEASGSRPIKAYKSSN